MNSIGTGNNVTGIILDLNSFPTFTNSLEIVFKNFANSFPTMSWTDCIAMSVSLLVFKLFLTLWDIHVHCPS